MVQTMEDLEALKREDSAPETEEELLKRVDSMAQTKEELEALKREDSISETKEELNASSKRDGSSTFSAQLMSMDGSSDNSFSSFEEPPNSILKLGGDQSEKECLEGLKEFCRKHELPLTNHLIFRIAFHNSFDFKRSKKAVQDSCENQHLFLRMEGRLIKQFEKEMFFPIPGLRTIDRKSKVVYYKPSLLIPSDSPFSIPMLVQNVCYVYNDLNRTEQQCRNGVAIIVDMAGYSLKNYSPEAAKKVMAAVQGQVVPCRVSSFLLINPPKLVVKLWKISRPILSRSFRKRTNVIKRKEQLGDYLMEGYEEYLPGDIYPHRKKISEMVGDYVDAKEYEENKNT